MYVPLVRETVIVVPVEESDLPLDRLMYQVVPDGSPVSVNVTVKVSGVKDTETDCAAPFTIKVEVAADGP